MTLLTFGAFVLLFAVVLFLALEESLAQAKKKGAQGERTWLKQGMQDDEERLAAGQDEDDAEHLARVAESALGYVRDQYRHLRLPRRQSPPHEEPTETMLYRANVLTGAHAFRFPRAAGLSICVHPPCDENECPPPTGRARKDGGQTQLLRVHDGYMFIEDRLLRFKTDGGRKKQYEAWHDSRWRTVERKQLLIQNEDGEEEQVKIMCVLDSTDSWAPLRVRESGWIECP